LLAAVDPKGIKRTTDDVVTHTWQILHSTTANKNNRVFLEVVTLTADVSDDFISVGQANLGNLTKRGVGLFRCASVNLETNATALWAVVQSR
jgi:hypothetical protein